MSNFGLWNPMYAGRDNINREMYDDSTTAEISARFLLDMSEVEDWGCGLGGFKNFLTEKQKYIGIDGSNSPFADKIVDLENYFSNVDGIMMRGVLEHNHNWGKILENAVKSFRSKFALVLFTPFVEETKIISTYEDWHVKGVTMIDIAFKKEEIENYFVGLEYTLQEGIKTNTGYGIEHIYFVKK